MEIKIKQTLLITGVRAVLYASGLLWEPRADSGCWGYFKAQFFSQWFKIQLTRDSKLDIKKAKQGKKYQKTR